MGDLRTSSKYNQETGKRELIRAELLPEYQSESLTSSSTSSSVFVYGVDCNSSVEALSSDIFDKKGIHESQIEDDYDIIGMETDFRDDSSSTPPTAFVLDPEPNQGDEEEPLLAEESTDNYFEDGEDIISGEVIPTYEPWTPLSEAGCSTSVQDKCIEEQDESKVSEWLEGIDGGEGSYSPLLNCSPEESTTEVIMSPATSEDGVKVQPTGSSGPAKSQNATGKNSMQKKKGNDIVCPHVVKGTSMPGMRKAMKGDIKATCSSKTSCEEVAKASASAGATPSLKWMCLQCGHVGCGDSCGQGGHAEAHFRVPRSDCHSVALLFHGDLDKAWCFHCNFELDPNSVYTKDCVVFLRRNMKVKAALSQTIIPAVSSVPIVLGPPPPPPAPKIEPPKQFKQSKLNKISSNSSNSRWNSGDWPLGLDNLGNTCFMNSALQCLSRTRRLNEKLDLYAAGNMIEILVTSEEPYVQIINTKVEEEAGESNFVSDECERFMERGFEGACTSDLDNGGSSPSSTEMDSLLDVESATSASRSDEGADSGDSLNKERWIKELKQELKKPLKLRLSISKESMAAKLRHCFRAITRSGDPYSSGDSYDRSEFYCRSNNSPTVFSPRAVQFAVSRHFRLGQQHDSHELLRTVVDMMKKDQIKAFRLAIMQRYGVKKSEGKNCDPKVAELLKMWDRKLYHKTFVDEIFGGELVTTQKCLTCDSVRRSHEEFLDLSLPIRVFRANPNPSKKKAYSLFDDDDYVINRSVEDCLRAYTEPEFLTGSNVVECENCHRINLERLANGADFEEVFPGVKNEAPPKVEGVNISKLQQKKQSKKRQSRQAKIKSKLVQSDFVQENSDMAVGSGSSLKIVEDHFKGDASKSDEKSGNCTAAEEDVKSSNSSSIDDYVVVQSTQGNTETETKADNLDLEMDLGCTLQEVDVGQSIITGDNKIGVVNGGTPGNSETNLSKGLSTSLKNLSLIENGMEVDGIRLQEDEEMIHHEHDPNVDELMDDLDEPAVDGVGNASDIEDDEFEGNGLAPLDLGYIEDNSGSKSIGIEEYLAYPVAAGTTSSTVADEGFSEGENSIEEKNSQSLSGSSSRNSVSETENAGGSEKTARKIPVTKCPCSRQQLISRPSECLTLHLKRFQHTGRGSSKLSDRVEFPYILNLTEFCSEAGEDVTKPGYKSIFDEDGEVIYALYGIVEHSGSLHFGHYVAYVKVAGKQSETGERAADKWFYISDSHVSSSSLKAVLSQDAYILFYERIRGQEKKEKLFQFNSLNSGDIRTAANGYDENTEADWSTPSLSYSYDKPATVSIAPQWGDSKSAAVANGPQWGEEENWEEDASSSTQQHVSSSNDTATSTCVAGTSVAAASVSSSSLTYPTLPELDGVSSSTDAFAMDCSAAGPVNHPSTSSNFSSHPIWNSDEVHKASEVYQYCSMTMTDIMEVGATDESNTVCGNTYGSVSSSSDIGPVYDRIDPVTEEEIQLAAGYSKLEEVD